MSDSNPASVAQLARLYLDIALLRRGPADVPGATFVLGLTLAAHFTINLVLSLLLLPPTFLQAAGQLLVEIAFMLAWYRGVLRLAGRPERFVQTASALFGCQTVLAPLMVVVSLLFLRYNGHPTGRLPVSLLMMALVVWTFAIYARVLRAATQWPMFVCVGTVVLQTIVGALLVVLVFGLPRES